MSFKVIEVQPTPNPNAVKFMLDKPVADRTMSFFNKDAARDHELASKLFEISGVSSLLLLGDFITVNKTPQTKWSQITGKVKKILSGV